AGGQPARPASSNLVEAPRLNPADNREWQNGGWQNGGGQAGDNRGAAAGDPYASQPAGRATNEPRYNDRQPDYANQPSYGGQPGVGSGTRQGDPNRLGSGQAFVPLDDPRDRLVPVRPVGENRSAMGGGMNDGMYTSTPPAAPPSYDGAFTGPTSGQGYNQPGAGQQPGLGAGQGMGAGQGAATGPGGMFAGTGPSIGGPSIGSPGPGVGNPAGGPLLNPPNLPPLDSPAPNPFATPTGGATQQQGFYNAGMPQQPGEKPWGLFVLTSLTCLGSIGGNMFLGWSYLDARHKYHSALRRTVRTFTRSSPEE
ncbi:MAG: hypothetical protein AAF790_06355, partial [Planctomycetota bacterium]